MVEARRGVGRGRWGWARDPRWWAPLVIGLGSSLSPRLAPATIEDQRSRLPPPAFECGDDPIAGIWQAHAYYAHVRQWYRFELTIAREPEDRPPGALSGSIRVEFWNGGPEHAEPPSCAERGDRAGVFEQAAGHSEALELRFDATDWRDLELCDKQVRGYLLDHFSGTVDPERMEFQSLLNADAPEWRDVPTVFRRVRCGPASGAAAEPRVTIAAPPYEPPEQGGCGFRDAPSKPRSKQR
jgi:hypothetical protein